MKIDAISIHERGTIIQHLADRGKWKAERMGAMVEFARIKTETRNQIHYCVKIGHTRFDGRACTVKEAVDEVNSVIHSRAPQPSERAVRDPERTGMPPIVRHSHHHGTAASEWLPYKDA